MKIQILHLEQGAEEAAGLTVIIDVFRAFSLEAVLFQNGAEKVIALAQESAARQLKKEHPEYLLIGERDGKILPGFDYGNSPSALVNKDFSGKTIIHTTTNGTQGLARARHAEMILTGALINAQATAEYILAQKPELVSLVAMGWEGHKTEEDILCAQYIQSLLEKKPMADISEKADALRYTEGKKFFDPKQQSVFPQADFYLCTKVNACPFAIRAERKGSAFLMHKTAIK